MSVVVVAAAAPLLSVVIGVVGAGICNELNELRKISSVMVVVVDDATSAVVLLDVVVAPALLSSLLSSSLLLALGADTDSVDTANAA